MLTVGTTIADRYEIVGKVGAGGMSDVYKAWDTKLQRNVAVKVLKTEYSEDRTFVGKFRTEAQSAAGLEHPNIVNIYDVGNENGTYYIVMEYVEGITLKTYIEKKGQLSFRESVSIAIQVARGIESAHNKGIIHRDIKPQNIIISTEGKVKVTDFGIARAASSNTISSDVMGSVHYASPEQARNGYVDIRSDIYSLGIVMFEMITGRVPFDGETAVAIAIQHLQEDMPKPSRFAPAIPISFEKIILKATQKSPERRYQNIAELMKDLRRCLAEPDNDFVVIAPLFDGSKTRVISNEELQEIREAATGTGSGNNAGTSSRAAAASAAGEETRAISYRKADAVKAAANKNSAMKKQQKKYQEEVEDSREDEEDEEDEETLSPGLYRLSTILGIVALIAIVIVSIYLVGSVFGVFHSGKKNEVVISTETESEIETETETETMVKMISLIGLTQEEAEAELKNLNLKLAIAGYKTSKQEPGSIIEQLDVSEGEEVPEGSTIRVIISGEEGSTTVTVPGVTGSSENSASNTLTKAGLKTNKTFDYSDTVAEGTVISQSPVSGSIVEEGTTVTITISKGKKAIKVPNVVGSSESSARDTLSDYGLKSSSKSAYDDSVPEGCVISQNPKAGKSVADGSTVTITISLGKEPAAESPAETKQDTTTKDTSSDTTTKESTDTSSEKSSTTDTGTSTTDAGTTAAGDGTSAQSSDASTTPVQ